MTDAEKMEQLRKLTDPTDNSAVEAEVAEIDSLIEDYNERIAELETKMADMDNYKAVNHNLEERELTEEILEESFISQLESLDKEDQEYRELQEYGTRILKTYDEEIADLHIEIADLDRRLRKNEIAVKKNIGIRLSEEELAELTSELESKKARLVRCLELHEEYVNELNDYEAILDLNEKKRQMVLVKQGALEKLKEDRLSKDNAIDKAQLRLDKDELARLTAGVASFVARKEYIINNPAAKKMEEVNKTLFAAPKEEFIISDGVPATEKTEENNDDLIFAPTAANIPEKEDEPDYEAAFTEPSDLDEERKAEIEDTKKELLDKKKTDKVKEWLKKQKKKFIAAGMIVIMLLTAKGCSDLRQANNHKDKDNTSSDSTISSQVDVESEVELDKEIDNLINNGVSSKPEVKPESKPEVEPEKKPESKPEVEPEKKPESKPEVEPEKKPESKPEVKPEEKPESKPEVKPEEKPESKPEVKPEEKPESKPEVEEKTTVELGVGEEIANVGDIFKTEEEVKNEYTIDVNSNIQTESDNKIQHGDEVGKELDSGVKLEDYTEEGKAVVELPQETETKVIENNDGKTFHQTLEDFFGGPISISDEVNEYLNGEENTSSKTR